MAVGGVGELRYQSPIGRLLLVLVQVAFWIAALVVVSRVQVPTARRAGLTTTDETLIDLSAETVIDPMLDRPVESVVTPDPHSSDR